MPNWCLTTITIENANVDELIKFNSLLDKWTSKNYMENDFGLNWLGNVVGNSGIGTVDEGKESDMECRGHIIYRELVNNLLFVETETAWVPMLELWMKLLDKYLPNAELTYTAAEGGCGIYSTNDPTLIGMYYIDSFSDEIETETIATENAVRQLLQYLLNTSEPDIDKLIVLLEGSEYQDELQIHKWEYREWS